MALPAILSGISAAGALANAFSGGNRPQSIFGGRLGTELEGVLLDRLRENVGESRSFRQLESALRESTGRQAATARQRLSDAFRARGAFGSGEMLALEQGIDRGEIESFSSGVRDILLGLEDRKTRDVLPFLTGASQEQLGIAGLAQQRQAGQTGALLSAANLASSFQQQDQGLSLDELLKLLI